MTIKKNKVVSFDYTLKSTNNEVLDTSASAPLVYLHGHKNLIPGLEKAMEGKAAGDSFRIMVPASEAYGEWDHDMVTTVARENFDEVENLEEGMELAARFPNGSQIVKVIKITDKEVTVDGNHPLAGMDLNFEVKVCEIRDATEKEIADGGVYQPSCNCEEGGKCCGAEESGGCCCHH